MSLENTNLSRRNLLRAGALGVPAAGVLAFGSTLVTATSANAISADGWWGEETTTGFQRFMNAVVPPKESYRRWGNQLPAFVHDNLLSWNCGRLGMGRTRKRLPHYWCYVRMASTNTFLWTCKIRARLYLASPNALWHSRGLSSRRSFPDHPNSAERNQPVRRLTLLRFLPFRLG